MFEHKTIQWIVGLLIVGVVGYMIALLYDEDGRSVFDIDPQQEYVTAQVDSSIMVRRLNALTTPVQVDTTYVPNLTALVAKVDSDSLLRYDLYRHMQEVVTIDMEEHKEHVFFTWDDIKAYFEGILLSVEQYKNKKHNDNH